jgi:DNA polymerase
MQASLRFRQVDDQRVSDRFTAWFEPGHFIVEAAAQFFVDRFGSLDWTILTPKGSLRWDRKELFLGLPASGDGPEPEATVTDWRPYYDSVFNPPRTGLPMASQPWSTKRWAMPMTQTAVQNPLSRT